MPDDDTLMGTKVEVGEALDTSGRTVSFTLHRCRKAKCGCIVAIETDEAGEGNMYLPADQ
jgi:hypothetical protein